MIDKDLEQYLKFRRLSAKMFTEELMERADELKNYFHFVRYY